MNKKIIAKEGWNVLELIFEDINSGGQSHYFYNGLAGIFWTINHLREEEFIQINAGEILGCINRFLHHKMKEEIQQGNFDFLHGAIGIAVYFLSRIEKIGIQEDFGFLIDEIENLGQANQQGEIKLRTIFNRKQGIFCDNLGMAHGSGSLIWILSSLYQHNIKPVKILKLLKKAISFLLKNQLDISKFPSYFPSWIVECRPIEGSYLHWCYGDLGVGIALFQAANVVKNQEWEELALKVLIHSTQRRENKENQILDVCLCHGAAGVAHIYNRMYHYTGMEEFYNAAVFWFKRVLELARYNDGIAGFKTVISENGEVLENDVSFLNGVVGVGLALISAVSNIEPKWDRCMLLS